MRAVTLLLALLLAAPGLRAAEDAQEQKREPAPTYQSPILSLLFLPVNVLIKMASVFAPQDSAKAPRDSSGSPPK